ncbi:MAG: amidohydrolase family protein, partial [Anaerobacillus sp.]
MIVKVIDNVKIYQPGQKTIAIGHLIEENGKISEINSGKYDGNLKEVVDGKGRTLAPSFIDTHLHLLRYGLMKKELDLRKVRTWKEMNEIISNEFEEELMEEHEWVIGRGLIDSQLEDIDHLLTAKDLEELEYRKPMFLLHDDGHECIV